MPLSNKYCSSTCYLSLRGTRHRSWKGSMASVGQGRKRAEKLYAMPARCSRCDRPPVHRHHRDGNTLNNDPVNIEFLCVACHRAEHRKLALKLEAEIIDAYISGESQVLLAQRYGVHQSTISRIVNDRPYNRRT